MVNLWSKPTFEELFSNFDYKRFGLEENDDASVMDEFYSKEEELTKIRKNLSEEKDTKIDLVDTLSNYTNNKARKLVLENTQKNEE